MIVLLLADGVVTILSLRRDFDGERENFKVRTLFVVLVVRLLVAVSRGSREKQRSSICRLVDRHLPDDLSLSRSEPSEIRVRQSAGTSLRPSSSFLSSFLSFSECWIDTTRTPVVCPTRPRGLVPPVVSCQRNWRRSTDILRLSFNWTNFKSARFYFNPRESLNA